MNTFLLIAIFVLAALVAHAITLLVVARIFRLPKRTWKRAVSIAVAHLALGAFLLALSLSFREDVDWATATSLVALGLDVSVTVWLMQRLFGGKLATVFGAWLVQAVLMCAVSFAMYLVLEQFMGAYVNDANSMSPNIRGKHYVETLPNGDHLIIGVFTPPAGMRAVEIRGTGGIVAETYESRDAQLLSGERRSPDRFICNKTKFPNRWEATVFKHPRDTSILYVKRLVGLPGERIEIREGAVWANGEKLIPPSSLGPIRYVTIQEAGNEEPQPFEITLASEEYFVLGDNTYRSSDSRDWGPLKKDLIIGVADLIYWPPSRWRVNP
jgi:signal peptidase I